MAEPLRISLDDLRFDDALGKNAVEQGFDFDLGNMCVSDSNELTEASIGPDTEETIKQLAIDGIRALLLKLSQLPRLHRAAIVSLPPPMTRLPRSKPLPTAKPLTRWESFARSKGIRKKKKEKKVWDEATGQWRRRYGYKRAKDPKDIIIVDAKPTDKPGESPFDKMADDKKNRVQRQSKRELRNVQRISKKGEPLPSTVQLTADLPKHGKGHPAQRKSLKSEIGQASKMAGISTASMGKFDEQQKGEAQDERTSKRKKRSLINAHELGEKAFLDKMTRQLVKQQTENILDVGKAMGRVEADKRRQRHREKIDNELSGKNKRTPRRQKSKKKSKKESLPKIKVTSRQKRKKQRLKKSH